MYIWYAFSSVFHKLFKIIGCLLNVLCALSYKSSLPMLLPSIKTFNRPSSNPLTHGNIGYVSKYEITITRTKLKLF